MSVGLIYIILTLFIVQQNLNIYMLYLSLNEVKIIQIILMFKSFSWAHSKYINTLTHFSGTWSSLNRKSDQSVPEFSLCSSSMWTCCSTTMSLSALSSVQTSGSVCFVLCWVDSSAGCFGSVFWLISATSPRPPASPWAPDPHRPSSNNSKPATTLMVSTKVQW